MRSQIQRLPPRSIPMLFRTGTRIITPSLLCLVSKGKEAHSLYAVMVGIKVQKSAVKRNRIKRIIRSALTHILPTLPAPLLCLVAVKKDCSMKKTVDMVKELELLKSL